MNLRIKIILVLLITSLTTSVAVAQARKWKVADETLTVWSTTDYNGALGKLHRDDVIEEIELVDDHYIKFNYKGQTAYVASYCCKALENDEAERVKSINGVGHIVEIEGNRYKVISKRCIPIYTADGSKKVIGYFEENDEVDITKFSPDERYAHFTYEGQLAMVEANQLKKTPILHDAKGNPLPPKVTSDEPENKGNPLMMDLFLVIAAVIAIPLLLLVLAAYTNLFFFVFGYQKLCNFYNKRAGNNFMPTKRMSKLLMKGFIPLAILAATTWLITGLGVYFESELGKAGPVVAELAAFVGLVVAAIYVLCFAIPHRAKLVGKRQARWETIYGVTTLAVLIPLAIFLLNVMLVLLFAIPFCLFILKYVLPGAFESTDGANASSAGGLSGNVCGNCFNYRKNSCPYSGNINLNRMVDNCDHWTPL